MVLITIVTVAYKPTLISMDVDGWWYTNNELVTAAFVNQRSHHVWGPHIVCLKRRNILGMWNPHWEKHHGYHGKSHTFSGLGTPPGVAARRKQKQVQFSSRPKSSLFSRSLVRHGLFGRNHIYIYIYMWYIYIYIPYIYIYYIGKYYIYIYHGLFEREIIPFNGRSIQVLVNYCNLPRSRSNGIWPDGYTNGTWDLMGSDIFMISDVDLMVNDI